MQPWFRIGAWFTTFTLAFWWFVDEHDESLLPAMIAIVAVAVAGTRVHDLVRAVVERDPTPSPLERWAAPVALIGGSILCLVVWQWTNGSGWGLYSFAIGYMGFGMAVAELRRQTSSVPLGTAILCVCAGLWVVGAIVLWASGNIWSFVPIALALVVGPVGITLVSRPWWPRWSKLPTWAFLVCGAVVSAVAVLIGWVVYGDPAIPLTVFVVALVVMFAIVSRSNVDVVLVVVVGAVLWTLTQHDAATPEALTVTAGEPLMVAFGDSYISGEGADEFFVQTNARGVSQCRRAPTAYAVRLVTSPGGEFPERLAFLACSGADIEGVTGQLTEFGRLKQATGFADSDVALVVLGAGGNDARFGDIGRVCLLPGDCTRLGPAWRAHLAIVSDALDDLYAEVATQFPDAPVVVVPYPIPIAANDCSYSVFAPAEHEFLNSFTVSLDEVITEVAESHGFKVADTRDALEGHRLCDDVPTSELGVNFVDINSVRGTLEQSTIPLNWVHNSLHPNELGHELMATTIADWCAREDCLAHTDRPAGSPGATPVAEPEVVDVCRSDPAATVEDRTEALKRCVWAEGLRDTGRALLGWGTLIILALVGPWLIAFAMLRYLTPRPPVGPASPVPTEGTD